MTCERCQTEVEAGEKLCGYCECDDRNAASRSLAPAQCSGEAGSLVSELRSLAATKYPLCPEARLLLEMAVDAQLGKPIDVTRLLPNADFREPAQ